MKRIQAAIVCFLLAILIGALPSHAPLAGGDPFETIDPKPLIDACWALSKEDLDSGVTARMRSGTMRSIRCLQNVIRDQAKALFDEETLKSMNLEERLTKIREGYGGLYWAIYNDHRGCLPSRTGCGTFYHVFHVAALSSLLEEIIRDMIVQRNEYRF